MTLTRTLTLSFAAIAMLAAPMLQSTAEAQGRRGRVAAPRRGGVVLGAYYRPIYLSPFSDPFYTPWFPYQYGWYPPFPAFGQMYGPASSLRLQVSPRDTEVFIDGYFAGIVDDFDGVFQRLRLEPGEHDVTLYMAGHRTVTQKVLLQPGGTFRIRHAMEPLPAGEQAEPRPVAPADAQFRARPGGPPSRVRGTVDRGDTSFGAIAIRVQPGDAEVFIDGERWEGPASDEALVVQIAPGTHRIDVRKDGYRGYTAQVEVSAGQTAPLNISLPRQ